MPLRLITFLLFLTPVSGWAQYQAHARAGLINYAEGDVQIDTEPLQFNADRLQELPKGQDLKTAYGRVELQLGPAASLWMGENGSLQIENPSLTDTRLQIESGSILIEVNEKNKHNKIFIQLGQSVIEFLDTGIYRLESESQHFYVFRGKAKVLKGRDTVTVKQGKLADLGDSLDISGFDTTWKDPLQDWAMRRSFVIYQRLKFARRMETFGRQMAGWRQWQDMERYAQQRIWEYQQEQMQQDRNQQMQQGIPVR